MSSRPDGRGAPGDDRRIVTESDLPVPCYHCQQPIQEECELVRYRGELWHIECKGAIVARVGGGLPLHDIDMGPTGPGGAD